MASTYHCYKHPKVPSLGSCRGCMLPMCGECASEKGYCAACVAQRTALEEINARRKGQALGRSKPAVSATGQLRDRLGLHDLPSKRPAQGASRAPAPAVRRRASGPLAPHRFAPERVAYKAPPALAGHRQAAGKRTPPWLSFGLGLAVGLALFVLLAHGWQAWAGGGQAKPSFSRGGQEAHQVARLP